MTTPLNTKTDHAEKFSRPEAWVRRGWVSRKPTDVRRLELRRVRRVRTQEVRRLAATGCERHELDVGAWPCADLCGGECQCHACFLVDAGIEDL